MANNDRIMQGAVDMVEHSTRFVQRIFMAARYSIGPDSSLRRGNEDLSETRLRIDICTVEVLSLLKDWAYNKLSVDEDPSRILPTSEKDIEAYIRWRAPVLGLKNEEVPLMADFIVTNILLNRGTSRVEMVLDGTCSRYVRREVQIAESERDGVKLTPVTIESLARLNDLDSIIGKDFDLMDMILSARINSRSSDDVVSAFKYVNDVLRKEIERVKELKAELRDKTRFDLQTPEDVKNRLDLNLDKISTFVQETLPQRFKQYRSLVLTREAQEDRGGEVDLDIDERFSEINHEVETSKRALQVLIELVTGAIDDLRSAARYRRAAIMERTFDMDEVVSRRLGSLSSEGVVVLASSMLAPLLIEDPGEYSLSWPGMLGAFKVRDGIESRPEGFTLTLDGTDSRNSLMDDIKVLHERCVDEFRRRLELEGELSLLEFAFGLDSRTRDEYMSVAAFREIYKWGTSHEQEASQIAQIVRIGDLVEVGYTYRGSECTATFNDVTFRSAALTEKEV